MKLTIIEAGLVPQALEHRFAPYRTMFREMFESSGVALDFEVASVFDGAPLPDPAGLEAIAISGSSAGVYEDHAWLDPLRNLIRGAYAARIPMVGICFGHQIMADALGGEVRKSEKGWGLGRHTYRVVERPDFMADAPETLSVLCSHQDQVIDPPREAQVILASDFAPNAGLFYRSGAALSFQPHPEFSDDYGQALAELRRDAAGQALVDTALGSLSKPSDSALVRGYIARFLTQVR